VCGAECEMAGTALLCVAVIISVGVGSVDADSSGESRVQVVSLPGSYAVSTGK
jgi:lactate dehydrogenase-like 2-hydroxyacid dehydrogenase